MAPPIPAGIGMPSTSSHSQARCGDALTTKRSKPSLRIQTSSESRSTSNAKFRITKHKDSEWYTKCLQLRQAQLKEWNAHYETETITSTAVIASGTPTTTTATQASATDIRRPPQSQRRGPSSARFADTSDTFWDKDVQPSSLIRDGRVQVSKHLPFHGYEADLTKSLRWADQDVVRSSRPDPQTYFHFSPFSPLATLHPRPSEPEPEYDEEEGCELARNGLERIIYFNYWEPVVIPLRSDGSGLPSEKWMDEQSWDVWWYLFHADKRKEEEEARKKKKAVKNRMTRMMLGSGVGWERELEVLDAWDGSESSEEEEERSSEDDEDESLEAFVPALPDFTVDPAEESDGDDDLDGAPEDDFDEDTPFIPSSSIHIPIPSISVLASPPLPKSSVAPMQQPLALTSLSSLRSISEDGDEEKADNIEILDYNEDWFEKFVVSKPSKRSPRTSPKSSPKLSSPKLPSSPKSSSSTKLPSSSSSSSSPKPSSPRKLPKLSPSPAPTSSTPKVEYVKEEVAVVEVQVHVEVAVIVSTEFVDCEVEILGYDEDFFERAAAEAVASSSSETDSDLISSFASTSTDSSITSSEQLSFSPPSSLSQQPKSLLLSVPESNSDATSDHGTEDTAEDEFWGTSSERSGSSVSSLSTAPSLLASASASASCSYLPSSQLSPILEDVGSPLASASAAGSPSLMGVSFDVPVRASEPLASLPPVTAVDALSASPHPHPHPPPNTPQNAQSPSSPVRHPSRHWVDVARISDWALHHVSPEAEPRALPGDLGAEEDGDDDPVASSSELIRSSSSSSSVCGESPGATASFLTVVEEKDKQDGEDAELEPVKRGGIDSLVHIERGSSFDLTEKMPGQWTSLPSFSEKVGANKHQMSLDNGSSVPLSATSTSTSSLSTSLSPFSKASATQNETSRFLEVIKSVQSAIWRTLQWSSN